MKAKILVLCAAAHAAAVALPSDQDAPTISNAGIVYQQDAANALNKRTNGCNADNCLRNLRDQRYSSSASNFCSTFIQSTITDTFYAVATDKKTVIVTPPAVTVTDVHVVTNVATTGTNTITAYTTIPDSRYNKRAANAAYPPWLSASYPVERVSSACSCFIAAPSPAIHKSITLTTSTETQISTNVLPTLTTTVIETSTRTADVAATKTAYVGLRCGLRGCSSAPGGQMIESTQNYPTLQLCKARCMQVPQCTAFQFTTYDPNPYCNLATLDANTWFFPGGVGNSICSTSRIYDRNCVV